MADGGDGGLDTTEQMDNADESESPITQPAFKPYNPLLVPVADRSSASSIPPSDSAANITTPATTAPQEEGPTQDGKQQSHQQQQDTEEVMEGEPPHKMQRVVEPGEIALDQVEEGTSSSDAQPPRLPSPAEQRPSGDEGEEVVEQVGGEVGNVVEPALCVEGSEKVDPPVVGETVGSEREESFSSDWSFLRTLVVAAGPRGGELPDEVQGLVMERDTLQQHYDDTLQAHAAMVVELDTVKATLVAAERSHQEANDEWVVERDAICQDRDTWKRTAEGHKQQVTGLQRQLDELHCTLVETERRAAGPGHLFIHALTSKLQLEYAHDEAKLREAHAALERIGAVEQQLQEAEEKYQRAESEVKVLRARAGGLAAVKEECFLLRAQAEESRGLSLLVGQLQGQLAAARKKLEEVEDSGLLGKRVAVLERDNVLLQAEREDNRVKLRTLVAERKRLREEKMETEKQCRIASAELHFAKEELQDAQALCTALEDEYWGRNAEGHTVLVAREGQHKTVMTALTEKLRVATQEAETASAKYNELTERVSVERVEGLEERVRLLEEARECWTTSYVGEREGDDEGQKRVDALLTELRVLRRQDVVRPGPSAATLQTSPDVPIRTENEVAS